MKRVACILTALAVFMLAGLPAHALEAMYGLTGLYVNRDGAYKGYTLIAPQEGKKAYLLDMQGKVVHSWDLPGPVFYSELLPNGNLLSATNTPEKSVIAFGGNHGHLVEQDWSGKIVWEVTMNSKKSILHHGFDRMPNGHTLGLAWEEKSWDEAKAKGRKDVPKGPVESYNKNMADGIWPDVIYEFDKAGKVVWEWHAWDHVGPGADQLNINQMLPDTIDGDLYKYPDWTHFNSVRYNEKTDQLLISSRQFGEILIIDKKTSKIVWRWGNPSTHGAGKAPSGYGLDGDQQLFGNHDACWLANGNISVFDNGTFRPSGANSRVLEINPQTNKIVWSYSHNREYPNGFYAAYQSSAQKLPNNNYLVNTTPYGHIFEVSPAKDIVWEYVNPVAGKTGEAQCINGPDWRSNRMHRSFRYGEDFTGLKGKDLAPKEVLNPGCPELAPLMAPYIK